MQQPVRSHTVVEDGMSALAKRRRAKLRQCQIQQPEPENVTLVASDHSPAAAQQTFLIVHSFSIPRSIPRLKPLFKALSCQESLHGPPGKRLADPLRREKPVGRKLLRWLGIGLDHVTVVEVVAVDLHDMVWIDFRRDDFRLFLVAESNPAVL